MSAARGAIAVSATRRAAACSSRAAGGSSNSIGNIPRRPVQGECVRPILLANDSSSLCRAVQPSTNRDGAHYRLQRFEREPARSLGRPRPLLPGREAMKDGFRVFDTDTHVNPSAEVLDKYVDPDFRARLPELAPYRAAAAGGTHNYRAGMKYYRRILGEAASRETFTGRDSKWMGSKQPRPGTQDDNAENRVRDMDDEGTDVHFLIPTSWLSIVGVDDASIEVALIRAYHRHMAEFCGSYPDRLTGPIVASTRRVDEAVREIREWAKAKWAVAVMPL